MSLAGAALAAVLLLPGSVRSPELPSLVDAEHQLLAMLHSGMSWQSHTPKARLAPSRAARATTRLARTEAPLRPASRIDDAVRARALDAVRAASPPYSVLPG